MTGGSGGPVMGLLPPIGPLIRYGVTIVKAGRAVYSTVNDFLNKSVIGRLGKKLAAGYAVDVAIEEVLGLHPGPSTKVLQIIWAIVKGDYTGAAADLVDAVRRAEKKFGRQDGTPGGWWIIDGELARILGRGYQDP